MNLLSIYDKLTEEKVNGVRTKTINLSDCSSDDGAFDDITALKLNSECKEYPNRISYVYSSKKMSQSKLN